LTQDHGVRGIQDSTAWCHEVHPGSLDYEAVSSIYLALDGFETLAAKMHNRHNRCSMLNVLRYEECARPAFELVRVLFLVTEIEKLETKSRNTETGNQEKEHLTGSIVSSL
jgi:hypothetical protein